MKGKIKTKRYIYSPYRDMVLGEGVKLSLAKASMPMIEFLTEEYGFDNNCIEGDIGMLLAKSVETALEKERKLKGLVKKAKETE